MTFILENIKNIKNIGDIVFAIVGSIIAILTYKAAKETILQPVRTEVIKKQTELLIDLLDIIGNETTFIDSLDYYGIISVNVFDSFLKCGIIFNDQKKVEKFIVDKSKQLMFFRDSEGKIDAEIAPLFNEPTKSEDDIKMANKKYYDAAKNGSYKMDKMHLTGLNVDFLEKILKMKNNPFLPLSIQTLLEKLEAEINTNLSEHLRDSISNSINESFKRGGKIIPSVPGVFNEFNHLRISHDEIIDSILAEIRRYLKIDSMP